MLIKFIASIQDAPRQKWQALFPDNPFCQYEFLQALEQSQCTHPGSGWTPHHLIMLNGDQLIAAMPCFIKDHSYGEYVFDWAWADAYQRNSLNYYPKLVTAIPFTPSTGDRLAISQTISSAAERQLITQSITQAIENELARIEGSSWHCLFPSQTLSATLNKQGYTCRTGVQYHWENRAYTTFDDFLSRLKSRKRKNIRKEREVVKQQGIYFDVVEGKQISADLMQKFYRFYHLTYLKISRRQGYLNLDFFLYLTQHMPEKIMMVCAYKDQQLIGCALFFKSSKTLFGRYWGCDEEFDSLHFEACYYQGIEYCIAHNIRNFDPGAQGEHKIARGFEPTKTFSNHYIQHQQFKQAIDAFIDEESVQIEQYIAHLQTTSPYKNSL